MLNKVIRAAYKEVITLKLINKTFFFDTCVLFGFESHLRGSAAHVHISSAV